VAAFFVVPLLDFDVVVGAGADAIGELPEEAPQPIVDENANYPCVTLIS